MSLEDRFEIGNQIYVGQVATAYPAVQKGLDRKVLLKVLHPQWIKDEELVERFIREGKAMAAIDHPNVVRVYECGKEDDVPYLALEWIEGRNLADKIAAGPLSQQEVHKIAESILNGLSAVHSQEMLHRDLKPDNILIGNDNRVILADFSLAGFEQLSGLTGHGAIVGSPAYMSPEIVEGEPASVKSDLFGVGVVLFEALIGSNPFAADDPMVSLDRVRSVIPPKLKELSQFSLEIACLVDSLLERNPDNRPADAAVALAILQGETKSVYVPDPLHVDVKKRSSKIIFRVRVILMILLSIAIIAVIGDRIKDKSVRDKSEQYPENTGLDSLDALISDTISIDSVITSSSKATLDRTEPTKVLLSGNEKGIARLTVIARPWANVMVDNEEIGVTPLGTIEITAGPHIISFQHDYYPPIMRKIDIRAGATDTLIVDLTAESVLVSITAIPWGNLWIDGDSLGLLPRNDPIWMKPGKHLLEIEHPRFETWRDTVVLRKGDSLNLRIDLKSGTMIAGS
ncbi:MAG: serine/threonine-protein kinase [Candidatus Hatepunaea meridiana]|nr:serine/threonine-protein kinase [Candidatus Hatepunaea meridiana]